MEACPNRTGEAAAAARDERDRSTCQKENRRNPFAVSTLTTGLNFDIWRSGSYVGKEARFFPPLCEEKITALDGDCCCSDGYNVLNVTSETG